MPRQFADIAKNLSPEEQQRLLDTFYDWYDLITAKIAFDLDTDLADITVSATGGPPLRGLHATIAARTDDQFADQIISAVSLISIEGLLMGFDYAYQLLGGAARPPQV